MSLSCTNQSMQPNVSESDSSSFIGPLLQSWTECPLESQEVWCQGGFVTVKMSVPVPMNVYLVLVVAVNPLLQSLICLNQVTSCLLMVLVGSWSQVIQWLDPFWIFIFLPLPEGMACKELAHPNTLQHDLQQWLWRHPDCCDLQKVQMKLNWRFLLYSKAQESTEMRFWYQLFCDSSWNDGMLEQDRV
jgi:hypothetical protein